MKITWRWLPPAAVMLVGAATLVAPMVVAAGGAAYVRVASESMSPTLIPGDAAFTRDATGDIRRGDIVVFDGASWNLSGPVMVVKRVIGIGGDTLAWDREGELQVNGRVIEEPYLHQDESYGRNPYEKDLLFTVPAGTAFVVGDWRGNSRDSRDPDRGAIPLTAIKSVVVATREGPLPAVTAFADAGLAGAPPAAAQATGLPLSLIGGGVVFLLGTVWLGLRLSRKRPAE